MAQGKPQWPEAGDLVMATIETVTDYGACARLDEYNKRGLVHVVKISSSWIRNIRDFVGFYVLAAPRFSFEALAENYKHAEEVFQKISQSVITNITKVGGQGSYIREK